MTRGRTGALLAAALLATVAPAHAPAAPGSAATTHPPAIPAEAAIVVDGRTGDSIAADGADERRPIASATKLMTALLTLERARFGETLPAADYDPAPVESQIGLRSGERMSVRDLLVALLLESANDAAVTLAEGVAGSTSDFVAEMNQRAADLGLADTSFANPIGFDDPANYSTAADLARLAHRLMEDPRFRDIVEKPRLRLRTGAMPRVIENRNELVATPLVDGIKTGSTHGAGEVLVASGGDGGTRLISVVLGAPSEAARDAATLTLLRHGLDAFERRRVVRGGEALASVPVEGADGELARLVAARAIAPKLLDGQRPRTRVRGPTELEAPLRAGEVVGTVTVELDGRVLGRADLEVAEAVTAPGLLTQVASTLGDHKAALAALAGVAVAAAAVVALRRRREPKSST